MALKAQEITENPGLGIAMMLWAYFMFSVVDTSVKWLLFAGLTSFQLAFMRYATHFVLSFYSIARGGLGRERFATDHLGLVLFRAFLLVSATTFNFIVLRYLSLTVVSAIMFSAPLVVCLLSWPMLGERVGPWRWFAIMLGFCGVLIVIRPFGESFHWSALLTCYNAVGLALYSILTRKLSGIVATETMQFYMGALGTITLLPLAVWTWAAPSSLFEWFLLITLGAWGWAGHELLTRAHSFAPANTLMPYTYSFMIFLTIESYLIFADIPDRWTFMGAFIVVISGLIIWKRAQIRDQSI
ncbi:DMT family transporter [Rhodobacteraceae bacterium nBUS_24]|jgi:drug/metabolite transporter (DMT)-like permease